MLNGLRPEIRLHALQSQKGGDTLNDLIKTAKLAEALAPPSSDTTNALLLKYIQASTQANEKQSKEMQKLTSKIAALSEQNEQNGVNAVDTNQVSDNRPQQRFHRPTLQERTSRHPHDVVLMSGRRRISTSSRRSSGNSFRRLRDVGKRRLLGTILRRLLRRSL